MSRPRFLAAILIAVVMSSACYEAAARPDDLPALQLAQALERPRLLGEGTFRWLGMKIYDARLWIPEGSAHPERMQQAFVLELHYARALSGENIALASAQQIRRLGLGTEAQRARWLERMLALFPDVRNGTRLTGLYLPQHGARFYCDGSLLGEIDDPAFASAFFSIWLHEDSAEPGLRAALLGRDE